ncbi:MAG: SDR family oxidoreductase [Thermoplasmata archaeon]|nr:SDR family oxidoreductase [Thermoplasmata archaeon]
MGAVGSSPGATNPLELGGRVVVVTGAAMGIGRASAVLAAREGAKVAVVDVAETEGERVAAEIRNGGGEARFFRIDVSREETVRDGFAAVERQLGPVYGLVNNAGIAGANRPTHELTEADWDRVLGVNLKGVFFCTKHALRQMLPRRSGSIVNLSSIYGLVSAPDVPPYHASKGAVRLMTKTDALLYAKEGVRVNSIHPGFIDTPMVQNYAKSLGEASTVYEQLKRLHPMGRVGRAEEIATGVLFLLSDASSFMTGSELVMDGGYTCQ